MLRDNKIKSTKNFQLKVMLMLLLFSFSKSWGQNIFNEGFSGGITAPIGWTFTSIGGTYTTAGNYGASSPSLKFDATGDRVVTQTFSCGDQLTFWIKGQGTNASSSFLVEGFDGTTWSTISNIVPIPTTGTTYTYAISTSIIQIRFTYTQSAGNLAFDDVVVRQGSCCTAPTTTISPTSQTVCAGSTATIGVTSSAATPNYTW